MSHAELSTLQGASYSIRLYLFIKSNEVGSGSTTDV